MLYLNINRWTLSFNHLIIFKINLFNLVLWLVIHHLILCWKRVFTIILLQFLFELIVAILIFLISKYLPCKSWLWVFIYHVCYPVHFSIEEFVFKTLIHYCWRISPLSFLVFPYKWQGYLISESLTDSLRFYSHYRT